MVEHSRIPENEILVALVGNSISKNNTTGFTHTPAIDWDYLSRAARYHRVIPFLYSQLVSSSEITVPPAVLENLKHFYLHTIQLNMLMTSELISLYETLTARGIPAIPYKGPILAQVLYNDIKCRQYDDLDILVHREDVHTVREILLLEGYHPDQFMTPSQESTFMKSQHHYRFSHRTLGFDVEIHWEISPRIYSFNLDLANVWERAKPVTLSGRNVLSLSPEDMLLILCEHGTRHYWKRLSWICDIARLIELNEMDWNCLLKEAGQIGSERVLLLGISLAKNLFDIDLPAGLSPRCRDDPAIEMLTQKAVNQILCQKYNPPDISNEHSLPDIREELFYLHARERLADRARYYLRRAVTPGMEDWKYVDLPDSLSSLYPFVRIRRLLGKYKLGIKKWFGK